VLYPPDIDPEFHRGRRDEAAHVTLPEPFLRFDPHLLGERPVVDLDVPPPVKVVAEGLGGHPGVHEDEGGGVLVDRPGHPLALRLEGVPCKLHADIEALCDRDRDDRKIPLPAEKPPDFLRVSDRCREAYPLELPRILPHPLERHGKLGPPLAPRELVDLVDDDVPDGRKVLPDHPAHQEGLERLRRRDEEVRR